MNRRTPTFTILALLVLGFTNLYAGPLSIGNFTQVKLEYQYTDYGEFSYPNPILFEYPEQQYTQPLPYIADFPENRAMLRVTQGIGFNDELQLRYQYSDLDEGNHQDLFNIKWQRSMTDNIDAHVSTQHTRGIAGFRGNMFEGGGKIDWAGFVLFTGSYAYYTNESDTVSSDAHSFQLKLRQALTKTTALQIRHDWFYTATDLSKFTSNTLIFWLSQYFPTQTILHLEWREHWDTAGLVSHAPTIEIDQYLSWASVLKFRGRYYIGKPDDPAALEAIKGDSFKSYSLSAIWSQHIFAETQLSMKFRYYWSDQDVQMNTYLIALEHIL